MVSSIRRCEARKPTPNFTVYPNGGLENGTLKGFLAGRDMKEILHDLISTTEQKNY